MIQRERVNYCGLINHCLRGDLKKRWQFFLLGDGFVMLVAKLMVSIVTNYG